ncbi:DUF4232 domain-containing protein [Streptomyces axinellae]|uniref:DUF4232 domain-containing protein n=1 Tax=Streptomyces axinellae TaxID=552788 RepID=A0ABN3Q3C4_9ACTN
MTQDDGMTATGRQRSASRASVRPRRQASRIAATATVALTAGALLTACGEGGPGTMGPHRVEGQAAPAGADRTDQGLHDKKSKDEGKAGGSAGGSANGGGTAGSSSSSSAGGDPGDGGSGGKGGNGGGSGGSGTGCQAGDLAAHFGPQRSGAGQVNYSLVFTNNSGNTCTMHGYPGLAFINSAGDQVSVTPERAPGSTDKVSLPPGASAWAPLSYANPGMTGVRTVAPDGVRVTPPDQTQSLQIDWTGGPVTDSDEGSVPKLGPLAPGTGG